MVKPPTGWASKYKKMFKNQNDHSCWPRRYMWHHGSHGRRRLLKIGNRFEKNMFTVEIIRLLVHFIWLKSSLWHKQRGTVWSIAWVGIPSGYSTGWCRQTGPNGTREQTGMLLVAGQQLLLYSSRGTVEDVSVCSLQEWRFVMVDGYRYIGLCDYECCVICVWGVSRRITPFPLSLVYPSGYGTTIIHD